MGAHRSKPGLPLCPHEATAGKCSEKFGSVAGQVSSSQWRRVLGLCGYRTRPRVTWPQLRSVPSGGRTLSTSSSAQGVRAAEPGPHAFRKPAGLWGRLPWGIGTTRVCTGYTVFRGCLPGGLGLPVIQHWSRVTLSAIFPNKDTSNSTPQPPPPPPHHGTRAWLPGILFQGLQAPQADSRHPPRVPTLGALGIAISGAPLPPGSLRGLSQAPEGRQSGGGSSRGAAGHKPRLPSRPLPGSGSRVGCTRV